MSGVVRRIGPRSPALRWKGRLTAGRLQVCGMECALTVAQVIGGRLKDHSGSRVDDSWRARVTGPLISGGRATGLRERLSWSSWSVKPL
jgi:hypothetical protein